MAFTATVYRILLASPSDVAEERETLPGVIYEWNALHAEEAQVVLLPVKWETHSVPELGDRPQEIINRQLVRSCDVLIGAFWTRIGTHTGRAESGSVEEIEELVSRKRPVLLYFSSAPISPAKIDHEQYARLMEFKGKVRKEGIVEDYESVAELRQKVLRHLTQVIRQLKDGKSAPTVNDPQIAHAPDFEGEVGALANELAFERRRSDFLNSDTGVRAALAEVTVLYGNLKELIEKISDPETRLTFKLEEQRHSLAIYSHGHSLVLGWHYSYANTLEHSGLYVTLWKGAAGFRGSRISPEKPEELVEENYDFDLGPEDQMGWRETAGEERFFTSRQLAETVLRLLLERVRERRLTRER